MYIEPWRRRNRGDACAFVINKLESFGLRVDPSSRWGTLRRLFFAKDGSSRGLIPFDDPDFEFAVEGQRDLNQISFVFDVLPDDFLAANREKLRLLLRDPNLPQDAFKSSSGRDTQAELYIAAICWRAGLRPVALEEPDVRCVHNGLTFGLAVKRLKKNLDRLRDRVREAASQIQRSNLPGLIVLDVSLVGNPENLRLFDRLPEPLFGQYYRAAMTRFLDTHFGEFYELVRAKNTRGIIVMDSQVRLAGNDDWEHCGMTVGALTEMDDDRGAREFESIWAAIQRGIPNCLGEPSCGV